MDRIPKFRRKPKNPTIETAIERSSSETIDSIGSAELHAANLQHEKQHPQSQKLPTKFSKKSAFRNFRLRGSAKRARESPTPDLPTNPPPAIVGSDGIKSRPVTADGNAMRNGKSATPKVPAFLDTTLQDIEFKFQELTWAERDRVLEGTRNEKDEDFKWGTFKQIDNEERGVMDRYINIKPWNHNRIRLQVPQNEFNYVNASDIILESSFNPELPPLRYIAMQGPTLPSISYVWRMIAEQFESSAVIVQLTTMVEGGITKCSQYFPENDENTTWTLNEQNAWGDDWSAQLTFDSYEELWEGSIEKRKLLLHVEGEENPRVIWHLLYRRWPDFGVPELEDLDGFFEIMRLSREYSAPSNPRIIHCSAGVGRTGTFITLEHLMRELDSGAFDAYDVPTEGPDFIYETVDTLRQQRFGMVQGKLQYHFIYQVLRKLWQEKYDVDYDDDDGGEPAAKRLEVSDAFLDAGPGPDVGPAGIAM
ncbi:protein-tyrosine phosphatase-like protein [Mariannaea sp. PMI_226]|nr:protein-tyrosine phosphatase-like protein [Mariannaea sp. PMI_226]